MINRSKERPQRVRLKFLFKVRNQIELQSEEDHQTCWLILLEIVEKARRANHRRLLESLLRLALVLDLSTFEKSVRTASISRDFPGAYNLPRHSLLKGPHATKIAAVRNLKHPTLTSQMSLRHITIYPNKL
jgi:hypothetical protein